jgi:hypothetical protein
MTSVGVALLNPLAWFDVPGKLSVAFRRGRPWEQVQEKECAPAGVIVHAQRAFPPDR